MLYYLYVGARRRPVDHKIPQMYAPLQDQTSTGRRWTSRGRRGTTWSRWIQWNHVQRPLSTAPSTLMYQSAAECTRLHRRTEAVCLMMLRWSTTTSTS